MKKSLNKSAPVSQNAASSPARERRNWYFAVGLVALSVWVAYHNSLSGPFIFDDEMAILRNPTIQQLWPLSAVLSPPAGGFTVSGRPLLNLSLAINYAVGGTDVRGYHIFNLIIHLLAALTLFGIVRRTLLQPPLRQRFGGASLSLAAATAILWAAHPLQTESVTYVIQRAESLMGLFYLLTLYCFIRGAETRSKLWYSFAFVACLCGMGTKEVMVTAPLLALLYDRTFLAGTFRQALRERWPVYSGLAATWLVVGYLVLTNDAMVTGGAGFNAPVSWQSYAITQFWAVAHYLKLSFWPHPLVLDYGGKVLVTPLQALPSAVLIITLLVLTVAGLRRWPVWGFAGCWFFGILALTSSVMPLGDTIFEHRVYLSLAAVIAPVVLLIYMRWGKRSYFVFLTLAIACVVLTVRRNADYQTELSIWSDTVAKRPNGARAQATLGGVLADVGRFAEAEACYRRALELNPEYAAARLNLGGMFAKQRRFDEAIAEYTEALRIEPGQADAHNNLGSALAAQGRLDEAIVQFRKALQIDSNLAEVHYNLGNALIRQGKTREAAEAYQNAVRLKPDHALAYNNLGNIQTESGDVDGAIKSYRAAIQANPGFAESWHNLGNALARQGRLEEAITHYREALRLAPRFAAAHIHLGNVLLMQGKSAEAAAAYRNALAADPHNNEARENLAKALAGAGGAANFNERGNALLQSGRVDEAIANYRRAIKLNPGDAEARSNLGVALSMKGRNEEAMREFAESLRADPNSASTHHNFASLLEESGRLADAAEHFQRAAKLEPDDAEAQFQAGRALIRLGRQNDAAPYLKRALELKPDFAEAKELLGTATD